MIHSCTQVILPVLKNPLFLLYTFRKMAGINRRNKESRIFTKVIS